MALSLRAERCPCLVEYGNFVVEESDLVPQTLTAEEPDLGCLLDLLQVAVAFRLQKSEVSLESRPGKDTVSGQLPDEVAANDDHRLEIHVEGDMSDCSSPSSIYTMGCHPRVKVESQSEESVSPPSAAPSSKVTAQLQCFVNTLMKTIKEINSGRRWVTNLLFII